MEPRPLASLELDLAIDRVFILGPTRGGNRMSRRS